MVLPPLHDLFFFVVLAFKSEATDIEFPYTFALAISRGLHIGSFQLRRGGGFMPITLEKRFRARSWRGRPGHVPTF